MKTKKEKEAMINRNNKAKVLGMLKVWEQRLASYIGIVNFFMIFYLYIVASPMGLEWYHWLALIVIGITTILYFDIKYVFPHTQLYTFKKNPAMIMLKEQIEKNTMLLEEIKQKIEKY